MTNTTRYKGISLLAFIIMLLIVYLITGCSSTAYWRDTRSSGIERYGYNRMGWPADHTCSTYASTRPIKVSTMRRQHFAPKHRKQ